MTAENNSVIDGSEERRELNEVASSRFFSRSPNLTGILQYVCGAVLEGKASEIKEYNVAVQALGRDPSFDPSRDSIVRVEISRLRKRLKQYYLTEGALHAIQIQLPETGYVPRFTRVADAVVVEQKSSTQTAIVDPSDVPSSSVPVSEPPPVSRLGKRAVFWILAVAALIAVVIALAVPLYLRDRKTAVLSNATVGNTPPTATKPEPSAGVRLAVGSSMPKYEDSLGRVWSSDRLVTGGELVHRPDRRIYRTLDPSLYQNARVGDFHYNIPLQSGIYELHLYFAEILHVDTLDSGAEGLRRFNVSLNGKPLLSGFDIVLDTGGMLNTADEKVFTDVSPDKNGVLRLSFWASNDQALLSGIEILPGIPGKMHPVRILAGARTAYDHDQQFWGADRYFLGGRVMQRIKNVAHTKDPELFASERFGNFSYSIPVAPGRYSARMYFAESNFGVDNFGADGYAGGGKGSRQFDIFCNGVALIRRFDILGDVGGPNLAVVKTFRHLQPNAQGKLVFSFVPDADYATVRAIEILSE